MTITSTLRTPSADAIYRRAHEQVMRFLDLYYTDLIGAGFLADLDEFVTATVNPYFRRVVDPNLFDHALTAYGCVKAVQDGTHEDIRRNPSGVVDNTLWLLDRETDYLDAEIRRLLNSIGIS